MGFCAGADVTAIACGATHSAFVVDGQLQLVVFCWGKTMRSRYEAYQGGAFEAALCQKRFGKVPEKGVTLLIGNPSIFVGKPVRYTFGSNRYGKLGRDADAGDGFGVVAVEASDGHRPAVASIALGGR